MAGTGRTFRSQRFLSGQSSLTSYAHVTFEVSPDTFYLIRNDETMQHSQTCSELLLLTHLLGDLLKALQTPALMPHFQYLATFADRIKLDRFRMAQIYEYRLMLSCCIHAPRLFDASLMSQVTLPTGS